MYRKQFCEALSLVSVVFTCTRNIGFPRIFSRAGIHSVVFTRAINARFIKIEATLAYNLGLSSRSSVIASANKVPIIQDRCEKSRREICRKRRRPCANTSGTAGIAVFRRRAPPRKSSIILLIALHRCAEARLLPPPSSRTPPAGETACERCVRGPPSRACVRACALTHFKGPHETRRDSISF